MLPLKLHERWILPATSSNPTYEDRGNMEMPNLVQPYGTRMIFVGVPVITLSGSGCNSVGVHAIS